MKLSELKSYIKEMIVNELLETTEQDVEVQKELNKELEKTKDLMDDLVMEEEQLDEMATFYKIKPGMEDAAKKALASEKEKYREGTTLYNTLDALQNKGEIDYKELSKATGKDIATFNNPKSRGVLEKDLADFIDVVGGGKREAGSKEPKEKGTRGRPKSATPAKKKDQKFVTSKLTKSYTTGGEEGPTDKELKDLARSGGKFDKDKLNQLRQQEKTKMVRAWLKGMRDQGIVDDANRVLDKPAYEKEWAIAKPKISAAVAKIR